MKVFTFLFQVFQMGYDRGDNAAKDLNAISNPCATKSFSGPYDVYVTSENQTNKYLTTALHYAAQRGHVDASSGTGDEKIGTTIVSDLQWKSLKVGKVRMHSIREGFVHSQWLKMGFECSFDRILQILGPYSER